ncbi:unnamed protein product [Ceratitis capitata]|uniref:(Mediterranean fruit fly) hypothetical protein n=1 Tax=Ceratitis capitata TaxID=7213 RepID=A0A811UF33_CERCA|nr:unnamed protein product [Ceratitis capitata]
MNWYLTGLKREIEIFKGNQSLARKNELDELVVGKRDDDGNTDCHGDATDNDADDSDKNDNNAGAGIAGGGDGVSVALAVVFLCWYVDEVTMVSPSSCGAAFTFSTVGIGNQTTNNNYLWRERERKPNK